jgi:signal transduction histidine kinase
MLEPTNKNMAYDLRSSLQVKSGVMFIIVLTIIMASTVYVMHGHVRKSLIDLNINLIEETGHWIVTELGQRISTTEALANSLVKITEITENSIEKYNLFVPSLLSLPTKENIIEGGGIWPEPFKFNKARERRAFFWGKSNGNLSYFNDYNENTSASYHKADWYTPAARLAGKKKCFWSAGYTDPHTNVPMVTCTKRITKNDVFFGVATVDLNLSGMKKFLEKASTKTNSLTIVFNRDGSLLSSPTENDDALKIFQNLHPSIRNHEIEKLYNNNNSLIEQYRLNEVSFFKGPALVSIFEVPETLWKIVMISPLSTALTNANNTTKNALIYLSILILAATLLWFTFTYRILIKPLQRILKQINSKTRTGTNQFAPLAHSSKDEFGLLINALNTRNKAIEESQNALEQANDELSNFAYRTSHDLRSPIASVQGILSIIQDLNSKETPDAKQQIDKMLKRADGVIQNQFKLINDILALCKTDHDESAVITIKLHKLCATIISRLSHMEHYNTITFTIEIDKTLTIHTPRTRMEQVLENLISNAIKYADIKKSTPFITISAHEDEDSTSIIVEDNAQAIPEKNREELFKMFARFHPRSSYGSGLGLYIVKKHVEKLNGTVACKHTPDGKIFIINLPKNK